jgi:hypothetical protein
MEDSGSRQTLPLIIHHSSFPLSVATNHSILILAMIPIGAEFTAFFSQDVAIFSRPGPIE